MCGCSGGGGTALVAPQADAPVADSPASAAGFWLGSEPQLVQAPTTPPVAKAITGSVNISTGTAVALVLLVFVGLPLLGDLLD